MLVNGKPQRTIWLDPDDPAKVCIIDQRALPFEWIVESLLTVSDAARAIREMHVRGAPLIGVTAAFGVYLAALESTSNVFLSEAGNWLKHTRPTAVDLFYAVDRALRAVLAIPEGPDRVRIARNTALEMAEESVRSCRQIGTHGLPLIRKISQEKGGGPVHILTHCNAGWLACIDYGTALSPIYLAQEEGISMHIWVDETRPRNQGARLTAFELEQQGIPYSVIVDNAGGHLMQQGMVDLVLVGSDRTTLHGDVANKIGTYLKALAAFDNQVPFYVALPGTSIDPSLTDGMRTIPVEQRGAVEVKSIEGWDGRKRTEVLLTPSNTPAVNYGFDITPARLVTGLITERGICRASEEGILTLFPEWKSP
ncbi:MAG: S-methyl-5-thioribose-1-phosphate isomerase [Saprospirales bacterium]|nr:S-methyl-5-thioribose-1-phosphate isomerase [Saprospirales bacterium]